LISEMKTDDEGQDSVWTKLGKLYCRLEPEGKYRDLSVQLFCAANHAIRGATQV
jgi:hypothetical protein